MKKRWNCLKLNMSTFLVFEILFRILLIFLFTEGVSKLIGILLQFHGYSYVTQGNYQRFLFHPISIAGILLSGLLLFFMILYEICGLLFLYDAGIKDEKISIYDLACQALYTAVGFIRRNPFSWVVYMLVCLPNLYLHMLLWEVDRARFIDIIVGDICNVIGIPAFVVILTVYLLGSMAFSLALPFRIFGQEYMFGKKVIAFEVLKGNHLKNLLYSFLIHIRVFLVAVTFFMMTVIAAVVSIRAFRPITRYVGDALFYGSILKLLLGMLIGFLGTVTIIGYMYLFFRENGGICKKARTMSLRFRKALVFLVVLITGVILVYEGLRFIPDTSEAQDYIEITAHRGGSKFAPENTLASIQYSLDTKADYAEIDVQETSDGEIVLLHDFWLARTTGCKKYIWDVTLDEVKQLDAGSHFSPAFKGEQIPTLREVIHACRGKLRLNIEIKASGHSPDVVERVIEIIKEENFLDNCVVTSMDYKVLREIKELCPEVVTGYTLSMVYGRVEDMEAADFYSVKHTYIDRQLVERVHEMGKQICAWTLNSRGSMRRVINCNVDNVITDNPELVRKEILQEYDSRPGFVSLIKYAIQ